MKKLCWYCKHFYYCIADQGYSEDTPGDNFVISCDKKCWEFDSFSTSREEFGKMMESAETCKHFKLVTKGR